MVKIMVETCVHDPNLANLMLQGVDLNKKHP